MSSLQIYSVLVQYNKEKCTKSNEGKHFNTEQITDFNHVNQSVVQLYN